VSRKTSSVNPFYGLLVVAGIAFSLTAIGYWLLMARDMHRDPALAAGAERGLPWLLDQYGGLAMTVELALLAVATVGAIATDDYGARRAARQKEADRTSTPLGSRSEDAA
jgi:hypothetical protein